MLLSVWLSFFYLFFVFFFNDTATTEIYTLSLHDALPISCLPHVRQPPHPGDHRRHLGRRQAKPQRQLRQRPHLLIQQLGQRPPPPLGLGTTVPGEIPLPPVAGRKNRGRRDPPGERAFVEGHAHDDADLPEPREIK